MYHIILLRYVIIIGILRISLSNPSRTYTLTTPLPSLIPRNNNNFTSADLHVVLQNRGQPQMIYAFSNFHFLCQFTSFKFDLMHNLYCIALSFSTTQRINRLTLPPLPLPQNPWRKSSGWKQCLLMCIWSSWYLFSSLVQQTLYNFPILLHLYHPQPQPIRPKQKTTLLSLWLH
jgi:hypothetical protein